MAAQFLDPARLTWRFISYSIFHCILTMKIIYTWRGYNIIINSVQRLSLPVANSSSAESLFYIMNVTIIFILKLQPGVRLRGPILFWDSILSVSGSPVGPAPGNNNINNIYQFYF